MSGNAVTVVGAGLAGSLLAVMLAKRGRAVQVLERRPDPRATPQSAGRSINLALAERGIDALRRAGVYAAIQPLTLPLRGRQVHDLTGKTQFIAYGQRDHEVIYSISRPGLNAALLDIAAQLPNVDLKFGISCEQIDLPQQRLSLCAADGQRSEQAFDQLIGADGVQSPVRHALLNEAGVSADLQTLAHGYKELTIPASATGTHQLDPGALHIWPRGGFMLIALPNLDGSFTATLFLSLNAATADQPSFASLTSAAAVQQFFQRYFADAAALLPTLVDEFFAHPIGSMATLRSPVWSNERNALILGDAAHAIVPFHGQGMNCAFEDCAVLDQLLLQHDFGPASARFTAARQANANAIADMALENYLEMRDSVRSEAFLLQKELAFELERRHPQRFIPRYSMVMFHHDISYAAAQQRGLIQAHILDELTANVTDLRQVDFDRADALITQQLPLLR